MLIPKRTGEYITLPRRLINLAILIAILLIVSALYLGQFLVDYQAKSAVVERDLLQLDLNRVKQEYADLIRQQAFAESNSKVDQSSVLQAQHALAELQEELNRVNAQLAFYQHIVSPEDQVQGLYVDRIEVSRIDGTPVYRYRLTVAQAMKKQPFVKGIVVLKLLKSSEPGDGDIVVSDAELGFGFRYFQILQGQFELPAKFKPAALEVSLNPTTKNREGVSRSWNWSELLEPTQDQTNHAH